MKTQTESTKEQQNTVAPKVQQETSTGGTATITDNRPSTIYQRKLRETMNTSVANTADPIQRKAPKGSSQFQKIASAMGKQHGVDTSGLVAMHNSSFPAKLNAEATIQGNKIDFAPGRDTAHNIRHEVAHAIDNTINGTPKGDKLVNGQRVDTTREKAVDRMAKAPIGNQSYPIQQKTASTEHTTQRRNETPLSLPPKPILQRKLMVGSEETDVEEAWAQIDSDEHSYKNAFKDGIFPVYDKIDETFKSTDEFKEKLNHILPQYSKLWNVENDDAKTLIKHQTDVQEEIKDDLSPYHHLVTTVGFEYEFASIEKSFLSGVPHLEIAETNEKMPLTKIPFILETDASNSLELVAPPFLIPTIEGIPLPHPEVTEVLDDKIQQSIKRTLQDKDDEEDSYQKKPLSTIVSELNTGLGVHFTLNDTTEIKAENLSAKIDPRALSKLTQGPRGKAKLIVRPSDLENLMVEKSKKVEDYKEILEEEGMNHSHLRHGIAPQLNFATDIPTVGLFEKENQNTLTSKEQVFIAIEKILETKFTKPTNASEEMEYFYIQMIRKLAGLFGVYYQNKTREMQRAMHRYVLQGQGNNNKSRTFTDIKEDIKNYSALTSRLKDTTSVWVKDHLVSIALMFEKTDIEKITRMLKGVTFQEQDFNTLKTRFGANKVYKEGITPFVKLLNEAIKTARGDLREKTNKYKWAFRGAHRFFTQSKNTPDSKPKVSKLFEHDKTKVGARQDTYLDPKKVQQPGLWPDRRLHVGEVREGYIDTLEKAHSKL